MDKGLVAEIDRIMEDEPKRLQMASNSKARELPTSTETSNNYSFSSEIKIGGEYV